MHSNQQVEQPLLEARSAPPPILKAVGRILSDRATFSSRHEVRGGFNPRRAAYRFAQKFQVIIPQQAWVFVWDLVQLVTILMLQTEATICLVYGVEAWATELSELWEQILAGVLLGLLFMDMLLNFNRAYYRLGYLETRRKKIAIRYLKAGFWIDLGTIVAFVLPWGLHIYEVNYLRLVVLLKFYNVYLIDENFFRGVQMRLQVRVCYNLVRLMVFQIILSHYIGIFFYSIGRYVVENKAYTQSWVLQSSAFPLLYESSWDNQYLFTLYFSISVLTTIAYGNITPLNPLETLYITFAMVPYVIIFAYVLQAILLLLFEIYDRISALAARIRAIAALLQDQGIQSQVQAKVRIYLQQLWQQEKARDRVKEAEMIALLPRPTQLLLLQEAYRPFRRVLTHLFDKFEASSLQNLVFHMREKRVIQGELVFGQEEQAGGIFFLQKGLVSLFVKVGRNEVVLGTILKGHIFGQYQYFTDKPRLLSARSNSESVLYQLDREAISELQQDQTFKQERLLLVEGLAHHKALLGLACLHCASSQHLVLSCPKLFYFGSRKDQKLSLQNQREPFARRRNRLRLWVSRTSEEGKTQERSSADVLQQLQRKLRELKGRMLREGVQAAAEGQLQEQRQWEWERYRPAWNLSQISLRRRKAGE